ncbi:MAG: hypothetical protein ACOC8E_01330 [Planctomycetota bacterium]
MWMIRQDERGVALIIAVAIMAVLAVIGFGFASSMKVQGRAASNIKDLIQARRAANAAAQSFLGALVVDATAEPSSDTGPLADHSNEDLYRSGGTRLLLHWGDLPIVARTSSVRDASSKMNLNAFGNVSKWYAYSHFPADKSVSDYSESLYHGANEGFSSFEISFEEFFYDHFIQGNLWNSAWPSSLRLTPGDDNSEARLRCANLARAICLYRYGGKADLNGDGEPDFAGDGRPGTSGLNGDDDHDDDFADPNSPDEDKDGWLNGTDPDEVGFGLGYDGIDNDGDGEIDEAYEGYDEPDEFNPFDPDGDGDVHTTTGPKDDRRFDSIEEFKAAISHGYQIIGFEPNGDDYNRAIPAAVSYAADTDAEAARIYDVVKDDLTVHSYSLDIRSVSIDDPASDGYDNDGDGKIDQEDTAGAVTVADIKSALSVEGATIYDVDINEKEIEPAAQAAYIYLKLSHVVTYTRASGAALEKPLVKGFTFKNALDIVDYRDTDPIPTHFRADDAATATLLNITDGKDYYGNEGLHITEVGRFVHVPAASRTVTVAAEEDYTEGNYWQKDGDAATLTVPDEGFADTETKRLEGHIDVKDTGSPAALQTGLYLVKLDVTVPAGATLEFSRTAWDDAHPQGTNVKVCPTDQDAETFFYGPVQVSLDSGQPQATIYLKAENVANATYSVSVTDFYLPYVEIMNSSRRPRDMTRFRIRLGARSFEITSSALKPAYGETSAPIRGFKTYDEDELDTTPDLYKKGPGFFVIVYDETSFERHFHAGLGTPANADDDWGNHPDEDFPIAVMRSPFQNGFTGGENVRLIEEDTSKLVAGGETDGFQDDGIGACKPFSETTLSAGRLIASGDMTMSKYSSGNYKIGSNYRIRPEVDAGGNASTSPGRWNHNDCRCNDSRTANWHAFWPDSEDWYQDDNKWLDIVTVSDAGYYRSAGELCQIPSPDLWALTISLADHVNDSRYQPIFRELMAFTVAARAPARLNVNSASAACLTAALYKLLNDDTVKLDAGDVEGASPYKDIEALCTSPKIQNLYKPDSPPDGYVMKDDDGDNVRDERDEKEEWYRRYGNLLTVRSHCFTAEAAGIVGNGTYNPFQPDPKHVRAQYGLRVVCDRGKELDDDGNPVVSILSMRPAD